MDGKPNIKPMASPTDYRGSKPTDLQKKKKKTQYTEIRNQRMAKH